MKTKSVFTVTITALFMLCLMNSNIALGQLNAKLKDGGKSIEEYYYAPVKSGDFVLTLFKYNLDFDSVSELLGSVILGGLILSYNESHSGDYVGVIVINTNNEAVALSVEKKAFKRFMKGNTTVDSLLADVVRTKIDLKDYPQYSNALSTRF